MPSAPRKRSSSKAKSLKCPLCTKQFTDTRFPVSAPACGHSLCVECARGSRRNTNVCLTCNSQSFYGSRGTSSRLSLEDSWQTPRPWMCNEWKQNIALMDLIDSDSEPSSPIFVGQNSSRKSITSAVEPEKPSVRAAGPVLEAGTNKKTKEQKAERMQDVKNADTQKTATVCDANKKDKQKTVAVSDVMNAEKQKEDERAHIVKNAEKRRKSARIRQHVKNEQTHDDTTSSTQSEKTATNEAVSVLDYLKSNENEMDGDVKGESLGRWEDAGRVVDNKLLEHKKDVGVLVQPQNVANASSGIRVAQVPRKMTEVRAVSKDQTKDAEVSEWYLKDMRVVHLGYKKDHGALGPKKTQGSQELEDQGESTTKQTTTATPEITEQREELEKRLADHVQREKVLQRDIVQATTTMIAEKMAREQAEREKQAEKRAREHAERKRKAEKMARELAEREKQEEKRARERAERKRKAEKRAREHAERKRKAEKMARERAEQAEKTVRERAEREKQAEKTARERVEKEKKAEKTARENAEREKLVEKMARERVEKEKEAEQTARECAEREKQAEKTARVKVEEENQKLADELAELKKKGSGGDVGVDNMTCYSCKINEKRERMKICGTCAASHNVIVKGAEESKVLPFIICTFCSQEHHLGHAILKYIKWKTESTLLASVTGATTTVNAMDVLWTKEIVKRDQGLQEWKKLAQSFRIAPEKATEKGCKVIENLLKSESATIARVGEESLPMLIKVNKILKESSDRLKYAAGRMLCDEPETEEAEQLQTAGPPKKKQKVAPQK